MSLKLLYRDAEQYTRLDQTGFASTGIIFIFENLISGLKIGARIVPQHNLQGGPMALIQFTRNYHDLSTDAGFQFEFYCAECGTKQ